MLLIRGAMRSYYLVRASLKAMSLKSILSKRHHFNRELPSNHKSGNEQTTLPHKSDKQIATRLVTALEVFLCFIKAAFESLLERNS